MLLSWNWAGEEALGMGMSEGVSLSADALETECRLPLSWGLLVTRVEMGRAGVFVFEGDSRHDDGMASRNTARSRGCPKT